MRQKIFQFWDTELAPAYIEQLMGTWACEPSFQYSRYSYESAREFIGSAFDARTLAAYMACNVPAMQADLFRLCALYHYGGVYLDADTENAGGLEDLVAKGRRGVLFLRNRRRIANDFMAVNQPNDCLMAFALETAIHNIEQRASDDVWQVTGPGILTSLYHSDHPRKTELFDGYYIDDVSYVRKIVAFRQDLPYKKTTEHWYGRTGIYRDTDIS